MTNDEYIKSMGINVCQICKKYPFMYVRDMEGLTIEQLKEKYGADLDLFKIRCDDCGIEVSAKELIDTIKAWNSMKVEDKENGENEE